MENNRLLNYEEVKCIKSMYKYAALAKYTLIALFISFLLVFLPAITNLVRSHYNVASNPLTGIKVVVVITILAIIWVIFFLILKNNILKNKTWSNILEKFSDENNLNTELKKTNSNINSSLSVYFLGNIVSLSDKLQKTGNTIKTIGSIAMIYLIIEYCSIVLDFTKTISKIYNIRLEFNEKLCFILCVLPSLIVLISEVASTANVVSFENARKEEIINRLNKNCEQTSYYKLVDTYSMYGDQITLRFDDKNAHIYSDIGFDENKDIQNISVSFNYDKSVSKQEIINNINVKLKQLNDLLKMSEINFKYSFLGEKYELSENFINKFININDTNLGIENRINDEYGLENSYTVHTFAYLKDDIDNNPTGEVYICFEISVNYLFFLDLLK